MTIGRPFILDVFRIYLVAIVKNALLSVSAAVLASQQAAAVAASVMNPYPPK